MNSGGHVKTHLKHRTLMGFISISVIQGLTFRSGLSLMRKRFLLKLSLRTLDQLKALIFV